MFQSSENHQSRTNFVYKLANMWKVYNIFCQLFFEGCVFDNDNFPSQNLDILNVCDHLSLLPLTESMTMMLAWKKSWRHLDTHFTPKWDPKQWECGQTKHNGLGSQLLGTADLGMGRIVTSGGAWNVQKSMPRDSTYLRTVGCIDHSPRIYLDIKCFTNTFLHTQSWLNWVDEDDWWGWGWLEFYLILLNVLRPLFCALTLG